MAPSRELKRLENSEGFIELTPEPAITSANRPQRRKQTTSSPLHAALIPPSVPRATAQLRLDSAPLSVNSSPTRSLSSSPAPSSSSAPSTRSGFMVAPKKKSRASTHVASEVNSPTADEDAMDIDVDVEEVEEEEIMTVPDTEESKAHDLPDDPWTTEQTTSLFKGIIIPGRKPTGMHKHFRMVALATYLEKDQGHDPISSPHMRIPGVWEKLRSTWNIDVIESRDNDFDESVEPIPFSLPPDEFDFYAMWERGRRSSRSPSPETPRPSRKRKVPEAASKTRASTVDDTDDTSRSSPPAKVGRIRRGTNRSMGRVADSPRTRQASKDISMDEAGDEVEDVESEDEEVDEEDERPKAKAVKNSAKRKSTSTRKSGRIK